MFHAKKLIPPLCENLKREIEYRIVCKFCGHVRNTKDRSCPKCGQFEGRILHYTELIQTNE